MRTSRVLAHTGCLQNQNALTRGEPACRSSRLGPPHPAQRCARVPHISAEEVRERR